MKRILFLVHNLGLGDVLSFSPLFLLALRQDYAIDILYTTGDPELITQLIFKKELKSGKVQLLKTLSEKSSYAIAILGDRRCIGTVLSLGSNIGILLPIPIQATRKRDIFLYNNLLKHLFTLRGMRHYPVTANPGKSIRYIVFEEFCQVIGKKASYNDYLEDVQCRIFARPPFGSNHILVHLFRDLWYKRLSKDSLSILARCLGEAYPDSVVNLLFNPLNEFEKEHAQYFATACKQNGLKVSLISLSLKEIAASASSAKLYLGVDHGISHLASLFCNNTMVIYGGSRKFSDIHLLWPPQVEGMMKIHSENISYVRGKRTAVLLHPSSDQYLSHQKEDSKLINSILTYDNVSSALKLVKK